MFSHLAFFGFTALTDPGRHREYNAWHQLDHLPENLLQPGVVWGDRWVLAPECAALAEAPDPTHAGHQYALMYWFRDPVDASVAAWRDLNERSVHWGRRPEIGWTRRSPVGFFHPVKGYAHPRVLVSPDALPFRPHRGVWLTLSRVAPAQTPQAVALYRQYDREWIPRLIDCPGVAGAWTFSYAAPPGGFGASRGEEVEPGDLVIRLYYLDGDPLEAAAAIRTTQAGWSALAAETEQLVFRAPLRSISPWQWDWFDQTPSPAPGQPN
jgi:hypothetical protein